MHFSNLKFWVWASIIYMIFGTPDVLNSASFDLINFVSQRCHRRQPVCSSHDKFSFRSIFHWLDLLMAFYYRNRCWTRKEICGFYIWLFRVMRTKELHYGKPIVAIFNNLIYIQFSIYIYVRYFLFIQFNIYIYAIFLKPFNLISLYLFNSIA